MSSAKLPLQLELVPSASLKLLLSAVHGLAFCAVLLSSLPGTYQLLLLGLIGLSLGYYWLRFGSNSSWFIKRLLLTPELTWSLQTKQGNPVEARLLNHYMHTHVLVLWFSINIWKRRRALLHE